MDSLASAIALSEYWSLKSRRLLRAVGSELPKM
jgi:hypothetical protein